MEQKLVDEKAIVSEIPYMREVVIPVEELREMDDIKEFWLDMIENDQHELQWPENARQKISNAYEEKWKLLEDSQKTGVADLRTMREAEYEVFKDEIDYRKDLLERLTKYIEDKSDLWRHKFSTSHSVEVNNRSNTVFQGDGSESRKRDAIESFAGQNRDSVYYVTKSGISLRLKVDMLFDLGKPEKLKLVLQPPRELTLFVYSRDPSKSGEVFDTPSSTYSVLENMASFTPMLEYRVIECTSGGKIDQSTDKKSPLMIENDGNRIKVSGLSDKSNDFHMGHQVNRIWF